MSIAAMNAVWSRPEPKGAKRLILLALADWADDAGLSWHSIGHLARKAAVSERHVTRALREMEAEGLVRVERRPESTSRYRIVGIEPGRNTQRG